MQDNNVFSSWLLKRGISRSIIEEFGLSVGVHPVIGESLTIPVLDENGVFSFNKYRRNPMSEEKPKYIYDKGGKTTLYGYNKVKDADTILITEGEMDTLVSLSEHIPAVSSTGGASSFQEHWAPYFTNKTPIICYDNDHAGGEGMVRTLAIIPHAKVLFLPDRPGIKDLSDYVSGGGSIRELLDTAVSLNSLQDVIDHRSKRLSLWQSTFFHDAYIDHHSKPSYVRRTTNTTSKIERARSYPIPDFLEFKKNKRCCIWHNERTPSLQYYPKTNTVYCFGCGKYGDAIAVYRAVRNVSFSKAVDDLQ